MFTDADYPAAPYPGARPAFSYVHDDGRGLPLVADPTALSGWLAGGVDLDLRLAERGAPPLAERVPLLSYGSNPCPSKLTWLRAAHGLAGPVVVLRARCADLAAVWAAGLRVVDDQRPAVLAAVPGAVEEHAVLMATADQVRAFDRCEGRGERYDLVRLRSGEVRVVGGPRLDGVLAYAGRSLRRRPLLVSGRPVRCAEVAQAGAQRLTGVPADGDGLVKEVVVGAPDPRAFPGSLFVYGTLQPGASAWSLLAPHAAGAPRRAHLPGTLFDTGLGYPALRLGGPGPGVSGWVVPLADGAALDSLDEYEGPEYTRVRVTLSDGDQSWTYVWTNPVDGMAVMTTPWPVGLSG